MSAASFRYGESLSSPAFRLGPALLFCPADRPDRYEKALARADAVILDLEDAVAEDRKSEARAALADHPVDPDRVIVRLNPAASAHHAADLEALAATGYRVVMLAKCEGTADLVDLEDFEVIPLCETARGVLAAAELAALPNVIALMWGAEDLVASMGGTSSRDVEGRYRAPVDLARSSVLLAAAAHDVAAIDAVHLDLDDEAGLRAEAEDAAALGFVATACVHPAQVPVVRAAYRPDADRVEWARAVLAAAHGSAGAFAFRGAMVDGPLLRQAETIVRLSGAGGSRP